ncbi:MAG: dihydrolipoamide acetyltransferase family protein [Ktedonobacteraceae bacterium]
MSEVTMPRLSDTMEEGTISHWLKKPGDEIKKGDTLAEIETDKATMDLEAYEAGTLQEIKVQEGETVPIGQVVAIIGSGEKAQQPAQTAAKTGADGARQKEAATPVSNESAPAEKVSSESKGATDESDGGSDGSGSKTMNNVPTRETSTESKSPATTESGKGGDGSDGSNGRAIKASPLARHMAEEHDIDLSQVKGTGPNGRIVRDDIEDVLEQQHGTPPASTSAPVEAQSSEPQETAPPIPSTPAVALPSSEIEVSKLSRVRMLIARRLTESKQTIPHFYVSSEVDMTDALVLRQTLNADIGEDGVKVTVNDLIVKACALALEKFPEVNSSIKEDQLITYKHINVGFAADVPTGLVVPVIRDTNIKGVRSIAREAKALIAKARANKLAPSDLEGGTFSVSNLGMMDASSFIAVINPPQVAILAVAATRKQFVPVDGQPVIRDLMQITLSADHRVIYGATVARFLQEVKRLLQNPFSLLG